MTTPKHKPGYNYAGERLSKLSSVTKVKRKYKVKTLRKAGITTRSMTKRK
jgi:hypothetical protein